MRRLTILIGIALAACAPSAPQRDWDATFSIYGLWKSDLGFTIDIMRDHQYRICDHGLCSSERFAEMSDHSAALKNFFKLEATERLLREADIPPECSKSFCGTYVGNVPVYHDDLIFHDNVANVYHREQCGGDRDCVVLGNVETAEGMFYQVRRH